MLSHPASPAAGMNVTVPGTYSPGVQTLDLMRRPDGWDETTDIPPHLPDKNGWPVTMPGGPGETWMTRVT